MIEFLIAKSMLDDLSDTFGGPLLMLIIIGAVMVNIGDAWDKLWNPTESKQIVAKYDPTRATDPFRSPARSYYKTCPSCKIRPAG